MGAKCLCPLRRHEHQHEIDGHAAKAVRSHLRRLPPPPAEGAIVLLCVPPDDESALADAMVSGIDDRAQRIECGRNAGRHARENYSWSHVAARVTDLYQDHTAQRTR